MGIVRNYDGGCDDRFFMLMESEFQNNVDNLTFTFVFQKANNELVDDIPVCGNSWNRLTDQEKVAIVSGAAGWKPYNMNAEVERCFYQTKAQESVIKNNSKVPDNPNRVIGFLANCSGGAPGHKITLGMQINPGGANAQFIQNPAQWPNLPTQVGSRYTIPNQGLIPNLRSGNTNYADANGHYIPQFKQYSQ